MGTPIRIRRRLNSETVHLPEARELIGRDVEIIVREVAPPMTNGDRYPLRGSVLRCDDPFGPAVPPAEWEAAE